jgi:hypothetical protein
MRYKGERTGELFMPNISSRTKENLSKTIGTDLDNVRAFDLDEEIRFIESQNNKKIEYDNETYIAIRGNAHLATNQVTTIAEVRKGLKRIKYAK